MVKGMLFWTMAGAGAIYLLDPTKGADRRRRAARLGAETRDRIMNRETAQADPVFNPAAVGTTALGAATLDVSAPLE